MKSALPLTALSALAITAFAQLTACSAPTTGDNTTPNETQISESSLGPKSEFDPLKTIKVIPINNCVKQVVQTINGRLVIIETLECATSVLGCQAEAAIAAGTEVTVVSASGTTTAGTVVSTTAGAGGAITVTIMVGGALIVVTALCLVTGAHETAAEILSTNNPVADPEGTGPTNEGLKCAKKTTWISDASRIDQCRSCCTTRYPWPELVDRESCYAGCNIALQ